ncbi:MAG: hypothetical protein J5793_01555 [Clostridia bacterium]|nr:hypothetical protein [Clostridia bacterium]MBO4452597.1 hypothetical protein [Clostridia bacterium]MBR5747127.1 hypothetical protein [Clostridia bacterium]
MAENREGTAKRLPAGKKTEPARNSETGTKILAFVIVLLIAYVGIILFIAGIIYYSYNDTAKNTEIYSVRVVYDETTLHTLSAQAANNEYGLYVPFSYLSEICSFGIAGDGDDVTMFLIGTDNRIQFRKNSSLIVINDNPIRISAPLLCRESDGEYLIPVLLIENYINGIDVTYDRDKMICYVYSSGAKSDVSLKLLLPEEMQPAYFPESYKTYQQYEVSEP